MLYMNRLAFHLFLALSVLVGYAGQVTAQYSGSHEVPDVLRTGFDSITPEQSREWLSLLAGPSFEGRGTGQVGYTKAAHWVAGKCAEWGLEPMGDGNTYFQLLPMKQLTLDPSQSKVLGPNGLAFDVEGNLGLERFADQGLVTGNVVVMRFAGDVQQLDESLSLRDKVVIYVADEAAQRRVPFLIARQGPAVALRVVDDTPQSSSQLIQPGGRSRSTSISGTISRTAANTLVEALGGNQDWLTSPSERFAIHETNGDVTLQLMFREQSAGVPNVVAWLEGTDPELRHEYLVIGAHLDHLGNRGGSIYPGADDNGSGSTAVLNIARALSLNPVKPKRSVLFIWFAAEEIGLVGSRYFVNNPTLPLENMICMLNIDMVGRNEEKPGESADENIDTIHLIGSRRGDPTLHDVIIEANQYINFVFEYDEEGVFGRSDQASFFAQGTSVAFLFGGFHPAYHQPGDLPEKINYDKVAAAAKLFYLTIYFATERGKFTPPGKPADEVGQ
ncbi:MAG TPA: M28 family peptidase [Pirellulaceae bacterium]|nr:M28 family peptidase [Pirellulaceae bacterium]